MTDEPVVLVAARAGEPDAVDDRMPGSGKRLERAERRERHAALTLARTGEGVPRRQDVVHVEVLIGSSDGKTLP